MTVMLNILKKIVAYQMNTNFNYIKSMHSIKKSLLFLNHVSDFDHRYIILKLSVSGSLILFFCKICGSSDLLPWIKVVWR